MNKPDFFKQRTQQLDHDLVSLTTTLSTYGVSPMACQRLIDFVRTMTQEISLPVTGRLMTAFFETQGEE